MKAINIQQAAELSAPINPVWRSDTLVAAGEALLAPLGGVRSTVVFPTLPTVGDSVTITVDGDAVTVTYASLDELSDALRSLTAVQSCYPVPSATYPAYRLVDPTGAVPTEDVTGEGIEIVFAPLEPGVITLNEGSVPSGTVIADTTEGIPVGDALKVVLAVKVNHVQAEANLNTDQILLTASGAYRGADGNDLVYRLKGGTSQSFSITVGDITGDWGIDVQLETNGGGTVLTTMEDLLLALQRSPEVATVAIVTEGAGYVSTDVVTTEAKTNFTGGDDATWSADLWNLMDSQEADGSGNYWQRDVDLDPATIATKQPLFLTVPTGYQTHIYLAISAVSAGSVQVRIGVLGGTQ